MLNKSIIGCIGTGNMGTAIISNLSKNMNAANLICFDIESIKIEDLKTRFGINSAASVKDMAKKSDIIIIAVKPDTISSVLKDLKEHVKEKTIISIAAGITIESIKKALKEPKSVIRVMPNTPALIGHGMSVISSDIDTDEKEIQKAEQIFSFMGRILVLPEKLMDAVTAVSGCGPAYGFTLIQAMTDGGVKQGIPRNKALVLSAQTIMGAAQMVLKNEEDPITLRGKVTSPGGSTIEAVHVLEKAGFSGIIMDAIEAAKNKTTELGNK